MTDIVDKKTRSRMMSGIRGKNTKPELFVRRCLHQQGFRFRVHNKTLPGKPDLVLKKYNAVIFVHGCFWHRHECFLFKWPKTRAEFWKNKINRNHVKDQETIRSLTKCGWRICIVWECAVKGAEKDITTVINLIGQWLKGNENRLEVAG